MEEKDIKSISDKIAHHNIFNNKFHLQAKKRCRGVSELVPNETSF